MKPSNISNYKIVTFFTVLIAIIKPNNVKATLGAGPSTVKEYKVPTLIELNFEVRNIIGKDILSKADPMVVVYQQDQGRSDWIEVDKTEAKNNTSNTTFDKKILITYTFAEDQLLKLFVYDTDTKKGTASDLTEQNLIGFVVYKLSTLIKDMRTKLKIQGKIGGRSKLTGDLFVSATELGESRETITFEISGLGLARMNSFFGGGGCDPFVEITKLTDAKYYEHVLKTDVIPMKKAKSIDPDWGEFKIPVWLLCNGDYHRELKFTVYDYDKPNIKNFMGEFKTNLFEFKTKCEDPPAIFEILNVKNMELKENGKAYKNSGKIRIKSFRIDQNYSFIDYIQGGTEICGAIAIDFTASNGYQFEPSSLHYINNDSFRNLNRYEQGIWGVVNIVQEYDTDKLFPVWGFGAKLPPSYVSVNHAFNVNMSPDDPFCKETAGVLDAYRKCLFQVQLSAPTHFEPILNHAIDIANKFKDGRHYYIFLIMTDGAIGDIEKTKAAVARASVLPMSIVIVGIGNSSDFASMKELDNDNNLLLGVDGKPIKDIVQFVQFKDEKHFNTNFSTTIVFSPLAQEVLAEVPQQFMEYMLSKNILPMKKSVYNYYEPASLNQSLANMSV